MNEIISMNDINIQQCHNICFLMGVVVVMIVW